MRCYYLFGVKSVVGQCVASVFRKDSEGFKAVVIEVCGFEESMWRA